MVGKLSFKFDHVDHYNSPYMDGTTLLYISYLKSLKLDRSSLVDQKTVTLSILGDSSRLAKERGMNIHLKSNPCIRSEYAITNIHTDNRYYCPQTCSGHKICKS